MASAILYSGPSVLDGAPIVLIATGIKLPPKRNRKPGKGAKSNRKTGAMIQTYILRADMSPLQAIKRRKDGAICGDCVHRGVMPVARAAKYPADRSCYVQIGQGPRTVYDAFRRGVYSPMDPQELAAIRRITRQSLRSGTYGDPTAVPAYVWRQLVGKSPKHTGYTHQWQWRQAHATTLMASVDSPAQAQEAQARGFRTFRVRPIGAPILAGEIECPASERAGKRTTCDACGLCDGRRGWDDRRRNITIESHGALKRRFTVVQ